MQHLSAPHKNYLPPPIDDYILHEVEKSKGISFANSENRHGNHGFEPPKYNYLPPEENDPSRELKTSKIKVTHNNHATSPDSTGKLDLKHLFLHENDVTDNKHVSPHFPPDFVHKSNVLNTKNKIFSTHLHEFYHNQVISTLIPKGIFNCSHKGPIKIKINSVRFFPKGICPRVTSQVTFSKKISQMYHLPKPKLSKG